MPSHRCIKIRSNYQLCFLNIQVLFIRVSKKILILCIEKIVTDKKVLIRFYSKQNGGNNKCWKNLIGLVGPIDRTGNQTIHWPDFLKKQVDSKTWSKINWISRLNRQIGHFKPIFIVFNFLKFFSLKYTFVHIFWAKKFYTF